MGENKSIWTVELRAKVDQLESQLKQIKGSFATAFDNGHLTDADKAVKQIADKINYLRAQLDNPNTTKSMFGSMLNSTTDINRALNNLLFTMNSISGFSDKHKWQLFGDDEYQRIEAATQAAKDYYSVVNNSRGKFKSATNNKDSSKKAVETKENTVNIKQQALNSARTSRETLDAAVNALQTKIITAIQKYNPKEQIADFTSAQTLYKSEKDKNYIIETEESRKQRQIVRDTAKTNYDNANNLLSTLDSKAKSLMQIEDDYKLINKEISNELEKQTEWTKQLEENQATLDKPDLYQANSFLIGKTSITGNSNEELVKNAQNFLASIDTMSTAQKRQQLGVWGETSVTNLIKNAKDKNSGLGMAQERINTLATAKQNIDNLNSFIDKSKAIVKELQDIQKVYKSDLGEEEKSATQVQGVNYNFTNTKATIAARKEASKNRTETLNTFKAAESNFNKENKNQQEYKNRADEIAEVKPLMDQYTTLSEKQTKALAAEKTASQALAHENDLLDKAQTKLAQDKKIYQDALREQYDKLTAAVDKYNDSLSQEDKASKSINYEKIVDDAQLTQEKCDDLAKALDNVGVSASKLADDTANKAEIPIRTLGETNNQVADEVNKSNEAFTEQKKTLSDTEAITKRIDAYTGLAGALKILSNVVRNSMQTVKELDAQMTEMAVVTDLDVSDYWEQLPEYTKRAQELGVTIKDTYEASTLYAQQGLDANEITAVSTQTLKMARIAGLSAEDATNKMTAALRGFNMEVNEMNAQNVADVYSKLAAITASDVEEISNAMTKVASLAHSANMEFETTAAFLSQIIETTRESSETAQ